MTIVVLKAAIGLSISADTPNYGLTIYDTLCCFTLNRERRSTRAASFLSVIFADLCRVPQPWVLRLRVLTSLRLVRARPVLP
jgi:hypothetical protein